MMTIFTIKHLTITASAVFLMISMPAMAVDSTPVAAKNIANVTVNQDSGPWRREPFIKILTKGDRIASNVKATPPGKLSATIQKKKSDEKPNDEQEIHLQGIMRADKAFHALINGRTVKTGDRIAGVLIKDVSRFRVTALNDRKEKIIYDIYQGRIDRGKQ